MRVLVATTVLVAAGMAAICLGQTAGTSNNTTLLAAGPAQAPTTQPSAPADQVKEDPFPKPLTVPQYWEFNIELGHLHPIAIRLPGEKTDRVFWYIRYTVTNRTNADRIFVPEIILYTDTGQTIRAGKATPLAVYNKIKALYNDPLLKVPSAMTGKLLQGQDNAKSSVAIWPDFDPKAGKVSIFFGGLSGETFSLKLPSPITVTQPDWRGREHTVTKDTLLLVKTLELQYSIPGEKSARRFLVPKFVKKRWVMR